jgi:hypothetical protein
MTATRDYLEELHATARAAEQAEAAYRREAARRIVELERERTFAFRRYTLVKNVLAAMRPQAEEAAAVEAARAHLRERFGWPAGQDERHGPVLDAFAPVAASLYLAALPEPEVPCDPAQAMAEFERWFEARSGRSFWSLQDEPAVQTPLVDF